MASIQAASGPFGMGGSTIELSRASSPPLAHRHHRRSYTISTPLEVRVSAFPSPFLPLPARKATPGPGRENKENEPPSKSASDVSLIRQNADAEDAEVKADEAVRVPPRPRIFHTTSIHNDRFLDLPPLPAAWETHHDRAICLLDSRNYSHAAIVVKLRRCFPELRGVLTPLMIDKRLRILDQNVDLDYWRTGLNAKTTPKPTEVVNDDTPRKRKRTKDPKPGASLFKVMNSGGSSPVKSPKMVTRSFGTGFRSYLGRL